ncbi:hypothetical protein MMC17_004138 [Xylographa soralifera]|nr:hypothetical protein [Xylographa soralifera]
MPPILRRGRMSTRARARQSERAAQLDATMFAGLEETNPYEDEGQRCEMHTYESRVDSRGEPVLLRSGCKTDLGNGEKATSYEAALVVTRYYSDLRELETTELKIQSPYIKAALKEVIGSYPGVNIESNGPISIVDEPRCLFHYHDELETYASKLRDKQAKDHVDFCLQYTRKVFRRQMDSYETTMQGENAIPRLEFQDLWMAFKPGVLLYYNCEGIDIICRLEHITEYPKCGDSNPYWHVATEVLASFGTELKRIFLHAKIIHFHGQISLRELNIFPLVYHQDVRLIKKTILERGRKYVSLLGIHHCSYDGVAEDLWSNERSSRSTIWALFDVAKLEPVKYNKEAFTSLVLSQEKKDTLSSLVQLQAADAPRFDDFVVGKGKGLIILLYGLPGVGKTFTAESIAEYAQRPLYTLGQDEIGLVGHESEQKLTSALSTASRWNAVVLMDEADVFMQERGEHEFRRNEQVSVLLRILEYFEGIMFLTTNRVHTIDPAFKSRIHLSLAYPNLSTEARRGLWKTFILKATDQRHPRWLGAKFLETLSKEDVNGREIKNIIRVAHALAVSDKRPMRADDILQGLRSLKDFERDFNKAAPKRQLDDKEEVTPGKKAKLGQSSPSK